MSQLNNYSVGKSKPFTILPPSMGEKNKLRIYAEGGLYAKIRIAGESQNGNDIELLSPRYSEYAGNKSDAFMDYIRSAEKSTDDAMKVILDKKFVKFVKEFELVVVSTIKLSFDELVIVITPLQVLLFTDSVKSKDIT